MPETFTSSEILRFIVAGYGAWICWKGRGSALQAKRLLSSQPESPSESDLDEIEEVEDRIDAGATLQLLLMLIHLLLFVNAFVNFWYLSAPIEQPNVAMSNVAQLLIPFLAIYGSHLLTRRMATAERRRARARRRERDNAP